MNPTSFVAMTSLALASVAVLVLAWRIATARHYETLTEDRVNRVAVLAAVAGWLVGSGALLVNAVA